MILNGVRQGNRIDQNLNTEERSPNSSTTTSGYNRGDPMFNSWNRVLIFASSTRCVVAGHCIIKAALLRKLLTVSSPVETSKTETTKALVCTYNYSKMWTKT